MKSILKAVVPGHKGVIVGSREDMIRRTVAQSQVKLTTKRVWDPNHMTYKTLHYTPDGSLYNAMLLKNKTSQHTKDADMRVNKDTFTRETETET
jgi:hypothetical protein